MTREEMANILEECGKEHLGMISDYEPRFTNIRIAFLGGIAALRSHRPQPDPRVGLIKHGVCYECEAGNDYISAQYNRQVMADTADEHEIEVNFCPNCGRYLQNEP